MGRKSRDVPTVLGIDVGSVMVSMVLISPGEEIKNTLYRPHHGNIFVVLRNSLRDIAGGENPLLAVTIGSAEFFPGVSGYDPRVACITGVKKKYPGVRSILDAGGEKYDLITFDDRGRYHKLKTNTSCAAGTGSFLDQQARRLHLPDSGKLSQLAAAKTPAAPVPEIASRCSVFAKTDIVHAQQEGYSLEEICSGLCRGLADNIADGLFTGRKIPSPVVMTGGVSRNREVVAALQERVGSTILVDENAHLMTAYGVALLKQRETEMTGRSFRSRRKISPEESLREPPRRPILRTSPLRVKKSRYPGFQSRERYLFRDTRTGPENPVETDVYRQLNKSHEYPVILGVDIGSTSTKAVLVDDNGEVLAGFYTRTAGQPLTAVQAILQALSRLEKRGDFVFRIRSAGTTGAGRKFAGAVLGADLVVDEISAHARAAVQLDPNTDTIIEIGGQDSKFTLLRAGRVNFAQMNKVCAAGTGSFLEEQARKLNVPLASFSRLAEGTEAPKVSDCCTVFMERDINRLLQENCGMEEVLAACLVAVRENYLNRVATAGNVGKRVCFQGATAKNRALVAAFEDRLDQPIFVSEFCHLTGALGTALLLRDHPPGKSVFRGKTLYRRKIPVRFETCTLCANRCRLRIADVKGEEVAYGFRCGRDYETQRYVSKNRSGYRLPELYHSDIQPGRRVGNKQVTVGLPAALHLFEDQRFWKCFFSSLSLPVVSALSNKEALAVGKRLAGAEFCSPLHLLHGDIRYLSGRSDFTFIPIYLNDWKQGEAGKSYCYYTRWSSSLVAGMEQRRKNARMVLPLMGKNRRYCHHANKRELFASLSGVLPDPPSLREVSRAYDMAVKDQEDRAADRRRFYREKRKKGQGDVQVVLLGRPYTVLNPRMNKGILDLLGAQAVDVFFQDMVLPAEGSSRARRIGEDINGLLEACHWKFAAEILTAARILAEEKGLYPVLITAFRCAPDSFVIEFFKRIMEQFQKPYLILQLDEHDSNVGYETRIEAALRAFENHLEEQRFPAGCGAKGRRPEAPELQIPLNPVYEDRLAGKTVLIPNWDTVGSPLLTANLRRAGIDARLLEETPEDIRESLAMNTGQCIPASTITREVVNFIRKYELDPGRTLVWMIRSRWACNIPMYPAYIKSMLEKQGEGLEKTGIYVGDISHLEISPLAAIHAYHAYLFGGMIRRLGCRIRPREKVPGSTDRVIAKSIRIFTRAITRRSSYLDAVKKTLRLFDAVQTRKTAENRPKVAIFGDFYIRDNDVFNQDLIRFIESQGGEVITTPYNEYLKILSNAFFERCRTTGRFGDLVKYKSLLLAVELLEKKYYQHTEKYLDRPKSMENREYADILKRFCVRLELSGESWENLIKIFYLLKAYPDIRLFVQTNPSYCCPALVTEAMSREIQEETGIPIATLTYDGTGTPVNQLLVPYLRFAPGDR